MKACPINFVGKYKQKLLFRQPFSVYTVLVFNYVTVQQ